MEKKSTGAFEPVDLDGATLSYSAPIEATGELGEVAIKASAKSSGKISVKLANWSEAIEVKFAVKESKNDVITATSNGETFKSIILNNNASAGEAIPVEVMLNNAELSAEAKVKVEAPKKAADGKFKLMAGSEDITTTGGELSDGSLSIEYGEGMKAGTYTYKLTAGKAKFNLKIVVNKTKLDKAVTLKQQAKLNVTTGQKLILVPTMKGISGQITEVKLSDDKTYSAEYNEELNQIIVSINDGETVAPKAAVNLTVTAVINGIECPITVKAKAMTTKPAMKVTKITIPASKLNSEEGVGTASLLTTYKQGGKTIGIAPTKVTIDGATAEVGQWTTYTKGKFSCEVCVNEDGTVSVRKVSKAGSFKVKAEFNGGIVVTKALSVKVDKKK